MQVTFSMNQSSNIRDPNARASGVLRDKKFMQRLDASLLGHFRASLSARAGCQSREMGPWWARDGPIVTPQGARAVPMYLCGASASVSEIRFTHQTRREQ